MFSHLKIPKGFLSMIINLSSKIRMWEMHTFFSKKKKITYANLLQNHHPKTIAGQRFQLLTFVQNSLILIKGLSFD